MAETKGYSIWIKPPEQVYNDLSGIISKLSGEYGSPKFEPHVTLLGTIEGLEEDISPKTSELVKLIKPFKIELEGLDQFDDYFRCLFIKAKETQELMNANAEAKRVFSRVIDVTYAPHLSLVYGEFSEDMKRNIISKIENDVNSIIEKGKIFDVDKFYLYLTKGRPEEWLKIAEFPLAG